MRQSEQRFWMDLVNAQAGVGDEEFLRTVLPAGVRRFADPPEWPRRRARTFLVNHVELIRANHRRLEAGDDLDLGMLNHALGDGALALRPKGAAPAGLALLARDRDGNPGTVAVRDLVARALLAFAWYADYRLADPAYPDASPDRFQVRECLRPGCGRLFFRTPESPLYCSEECAGADGPAGDET